MVGNGSSVIDFEIQNTGYGYRENAILTVAIGGTTGNKSTTSILFYANELKNHLMLLLMELLMISSPGVGTGL